MVIALPHLSAILEPVSNLAELITEDETVTSALIKGADITLTNFRFCDLFNVRFKDCALDEADFYGASLKNVLLQNCTLEHTQFSTATFSKVDFRTSTINGVLGMGSFGSAIIDSMQLIAIAPVLAQEFKITVTED